ncbi:MAG: glycosyl transferase, group 1 [Chitinophagaceae bacterium]|nr:glycosyl transferase, group 1 [Chitinophagaceae bacterium]
MKKKNILILYAEVMPYNVATFHSLVDNNEDYFLHVVCYAKEKKLTKYQQPAHANITYYRKSDFNEDKLRSLYDELNPVLLLVSGRMEADYLKIALLAKKRLTKVVGMSDNQYTGSLKQKVAIALSYFLYRRYFDYMLVPGLFQFEYAKKLKFRNEEIYSPLYVADTALFEKFHVNKNAGNYDPKDILFLGRLEKIKGIETLINVHKKLYTNRTISEKLVIVGDGSLKDKLDLNYEGVIYHSFLPQHEIVLLLNTIKYFCLPSIEEAWGVVIHEAASAGLPIVTTNRCGASTAFVKQGDNGYLFEANDERALETILVNMHLKNREELKIMGQRSYELSKQIQPKMWVEVVKSLSLKK